MSFPIPILLLIILFLNFTCRQDDSNLHTLGTEVLPHQAFEPVVSVIVLTDEAKAIRIGTGTLVTDASSPTSNPQYVLTAAHVVQQESGLFAKRVREILIVPTRAPQETYKEWLNRLSREFQEGRLADYVVDQWHYSSSTHDKDIALLGVPKAHRNSTALKVKINQPIPFTDANTRLLTVTAGLNRKGSPDQPPEAGGKCRVCLPIDDANQFTFHKWVAVTRHSAMLDQNDQASRIFAVPLDSFNPAIPTKGDSGSPLIVQRVELIDGQEQIKEQWVVGVLAGNIDQKVDFSLLKDGNSLTNMKEMILTNRNSSFTLYGSQCSSAEKIGQFFVKLFTEAS